MIFLRRGLTALSRTEAAHAEHNTKTDDAVTGEDEMPGETPESRRERADLAAMLAMTLHNAAVQHEHLEQWKHALAAYQCAANCAAECLGTEHSITISLATACKDATRTIARQTGIVRRGGASNAGRLNRATSPKPRYPTKRNEAYRSSSRGAGSAR